MSNQLDQRIRRLVVEVVDAAPQPPGFDELELPAPQRRPTRRIVVVAVAALTVIALAIGAAFLVRDVRSVTRPAGPIRHGVARLPLDSVPEGVTARRYLGTPVFISRHGDDVKTFLTDNQTTYSSRALRWCPDEKVFKGERGEVFGEDGQGLVIAQYGLDQLATRVLQDAVEIDLRRIIPDNRSNPRGTAIFCSRTGAAVQPRSNGLPAFADIEALPTLNFTMTRYVVRSPTRLTEIHFVSRGGTHRLVIEGKGRRIRLDAAVDGEIRRVDLEPGLYDVYCSIPGHRAAGMDATLWVMGK